MATQGASLIPDYQATQGAGLVGTIATTANTGAIKVGVYRIFKLVFSVQPIAATPALLRFTLGNSTGTAAPTPVATSPLLRSDQENIFELNNVYDQINLANLAADNGAVTVAYSIIPLAKS